MPDPDPNRVLDPDAPSRRALIPEPCYDPRPEGGVGAADDNSGGGNASGNPSAEIAMRSDSIALRGDVEHDKRALFPERFGPAAGPWAEGITSFEQFWSYYLRQHRDPLNRRLHLLGAAAGLTAGAAGLSPLLVGGRPRWRLILSALVLGYGLAWLGHFFIEHNRPASFGKPGWSLRADLRMLGLWLAGRLGGELRRQNIPERPRAVAP